MESTERDKASEEELQALRIIINKRVDIERVFSLIDNPTLITCAHLYNQNRTGSNSLTKKEFDLVEKICYNIREENQEN